MATLALHNKKPVVSITVGDPAGIGPEIVVKALSDPLINEGMRLVVYADSCVLKAALKIAGSAYRLCPVYSPREAQFEEGTIYCVDTGVLADIVPYGVISASAGRAGFACLNRAIDDALAGEVDALATAPLNKESLRAAGAPFIDHTAALDARAAITAPMTLFLVQNLKIFFLTRHIPFNEIAGTITQDKIIEAVPLCLTYLRQLGVHDPLLAIAALNPHGGERGLFGIEEMVVIGPAVAKCKQLGYRVTGPVPADSVFHQAMNGHYDGVLSLYHDQGHIAAKTLDFYGTVSLTMGLKFLRTSVDHGTAFDIAGRGIADARGMIAAILAAGRYALSLKESLYR